MRAMVNEARRWSARLLKAALCSWLSNAGPILAVADTQFTYRLGSEHPTSLSRDS